MLHRRGCPGRGGAAAARRAGPRPGPGAASGLTAVHDASANDAWAIGNVIDSGGGSQAEILHWDGTRWTQALTIDKNFVTLNSVTATSASDAWAVGLSSGTAGVSTFIVHWDGTSWTPV